MLALHACDTATDDALARALRVGGRRSCSPRRAATTTCSASCRRPDAPEPYAMLTRHGILRERFADVLTDALRAALLRRGRLPRRRRRVRRLRAHAAQHAAARGPHRGHGADAAREYDDLVAAWGVRPGWVSCSARGVGDQPVKRADARTSVCHRP